MASRVIKVPDRISSIRFTALSIDDIITVHDRTGELLLRPEGGRSDWYSRAGGTRAAARPLRTGLLHPHEGRLVLGIGEIGEYSEEMSMRNYAMLNWGRGNILGAMYTITDEDDKDRFSGRRPRTGQRAVCVEHTGDNHFRYARVTHDARRPRSDYRGTRSFHAYALADPNPVRLLPVEFTLR